MYPVPARRRFFKGKFFAFILLLMFMASVVFLSRNFLLIKGLDYLLSSVFPKSKSHKIVYDKAYWEGGRVIISGMHLVEEDLDVNVDRVEVDFHFNVKKWFFEPHLKMIHPQIRVLSTDSEVQSVNILGALIPTNSYCLKLDVQNGVLGIEMQRFYFSFKSNEEKEHIGTLYVTHDPSLIKDSYLIADFQMHEKKLYCALNIEQMASERLLYLLSMTHPKMASQWENAQGQTQLKGKAVIDFKTGIEELTCQFSIQNLEIANPKKKLIARAQSFKGDFSYPSASTEHVENPLIWQQMTSSIILEKGEMYLDERWSATDLQGTLSLSPQEDPRLDLRGDLQTPTKPLKFQLEGRGALHEDDSFWLELAMCLSESKEKECALHLSLCSPEKQTFVVQAEFKEMLGEQLDLFRSLSTGMFPAAETWKIDGGSFHGKCIAWFDKSELSHIEFEHFLGKEIIFTTFDKKSLQIGTLKFSGHLSQVFPVVNGELSLETSFPLKRWMDPAFFQEPEPYASLVSNIRWRKGTSKVTGSLVVNDQKDLLQFGFECSQLFPTQFRDIKEGWLHSSALSPVIYNSILQSVFPSCKLQGEMDVCGTFDGKELELSIQANQLKTSLPNLEMQVDAIGEKDPLFLKTDGRAKLVYDFPSKKFEAKIPLTSAKILEPKQQFLLDHVDGHLYLFMAGEEFKIQGKCRSAELKIPQHDLLEGVEFTFNIDGKTGETLIENVKGRTSGDNPEPFGFLAKTIHLKEENSLIDAKLLQNGKELIVLKAEAPKTLQEWRGKLQLTKEMSVQGTFETYLFSDPSKAFLAIESYCQNGDFFGKEVQAFALSLKKQGNQFLIEQLKADDLIFKSKGVYENETIHLMDSSLIWKDLALQGSTNISFQMQKDWLLQAEMGFDLSTTVPCPLQLHVHPGMKVAFSPASGFMFTDIHVSGENSACAVEYIEYLPKSQKWKAQNCKCELAPNFTTFLSESKPQFKNITLNEPLQSIFNLSSEKQHLSIVGKIFRACGWTEKKQDLLFLFEHAENKGKLVLQEASREERIQLELNFDKDQEVVIEKINGAIAGLTLHLKREDAHLYTGEAKVDFKEFSQFFSKDLNDTFTYWKMGGGYQLQGQFILPEEGIKEMKFQGKIMGEEFECMGVKLKKLEAKAILSSKEAIIENLQIKDEFGSMTVKKALFARPSTQSNWSFSIPYIALSDFAPYELMGQQNKHLLIKQASITNFSGRFGDFPTFKGQGSLHFTNRAKKEFSIFEIPLEIIKNLGLDPGLFTPVSGEVDFDLLQGKCLITKLKNVRSEGGRSEFYLSQAPISSYLDLNGNIFVDLKMKQNVVLNLTEPFTLSIRGTFKEPKYSLR